MVCSPTLVSPRKRKQMSVEFESPPRCFLYGPAFIPMPQRLVSAPFRPAMKTNGGLSTVSAHALFFFWPYNRSNAGVATLDTDVKLGRPLRVDALPPRQIPNRRCLRMLLQPTGGSGKQREI